MAASSNFFHTTLNRLSDLSPTNHVSLYLRGVTSADLTHVLDFIYRGQVNVCQEELTSFLAVAEDLQVRGLTEENQGGRRGVKRGAGSVDPGQQVKKKAVSEKVSG